MREMYEKYFADIVKTINEQIQKKWPALVCRDAKSCVSTEPNMFAWAQVNTPELYTQERALDTEINALWDNLLPLSPPPEGEKWGGDFEKFKAKVLAWGRVVLQIYKKFAES